MVAVSPAVATGPGLVHDFGGGQLVLGTGWAVGAVLWQVPAAESAGTVAETVVRLPRDARVEQAVFELSAQAVENAVLSSVAHVVATTPTGEHTAAASVDFGGLVVVGGLQPTVLLGAVDVDDVQRWTGTGWSWLSGGASFPDTATQRLLVQTEASGEDADEYAERLAAQVGVRLPAVPAGLELLVAGRTVWFERQGSSVVPGAAAPADGPGAAYVVERTDAVRAALADAVAAAPPDAAEVGIPVALRASSPGRLTLTPRVSALRVHAVVFDPEGRTRSVDLPEEGVVQVDVTPPSAAAVHEVALTARGRFGPERVVPATGPVVAPAARLVLAAGRTVLLGLPRTLLARLSTLTGVRLRLQLPEGSSGGQVTGRLLAVAADGGPGAPLPDGELVALDVRTPQAAWHTLAPAAPTVVPAPAPGDTGAVGAWLELSPAYGEVECLLTAAQETSATAPGAPLRRRLAGGAAVPLTTLPALGQLRAAVRLVGLPDPERPLPAVVLQVAGSPDSLGTSPAPDGVGIALTLRSPVAVTGAVRLEATCSAPGSLVLEQVLVTYRPTGSSP